MREEGDDREGRLVMREGFLPLPEGQETLQWKVAEPKWLQQGERNKSSKQDGMLNLFYKCLYYNLVFKPLDLCARQLVSYVHKSSERWRCIPRPN